MESSSGLLRSSGQGIISLFDNLLNAIGQVDKADIDDLKTISERAKEITLAASKRIATLEDPEKASENYATTNKLIKRAENSEIFFKILLAVGVVILAIGVLATAAALLPNAATLPFISSISYASVSVATALGTTELTVAVFTLGVGAGVVLTGALGWAYNNYKGSLLHQQLQTLEKTYPELKPIDLEEVDLP